MTFLNLAQLDLSSSFDSHQVINTTARAAFHNKSSFYQMFHRAEKKEVDNYFFNELIVKLQQRNGLASKELTERLWFYALRHEKIHWQSHQKLTSDCLKKILKAFDERVFYHGKGVLAPSTDEVKNVQSFVEFMLLKRTQIDSSLFSCKNVKGVLIKKDELLLNEFRNEIQNALNEGFEFFQQGETDEGLFRIFVFNLLGLIPFSYPHIGTEISIPTKIEGNWSQVTYEVERIFSLSPGWFSSPLPAFGFVPKENEKATSFVAFPGTTFPAADGFLASFLSDCTPGFSVGHAASLYGEKEMHEWLSEKGQVDMVGISLGGAFVLNMARMFSDFIRDGYAFDAPGLYPWANFHTEVNLYIYNQWNDLISTMGYFPYGKNVTIYKVLQEKEENSIYAHLKVYTGGGNLAIFKSSSEFENERLEKHLLTALHVATSPITVSIVLPIHSVTRLIKVLFKAVTCQYAENPERMRDNILIASTVAFAALLIIAGTLALLMPYTTYPSHLLQFVSQINPDVYTAMAITSIALGTIVWAAMFINRHFLMNSSKEIQITV